MKKITSILLSGFVLFLFLTSCKTSHIVYSWSTPSLDLKQYKKVLVLGLMGDKDEPLRADIEINMAEALNAHGMNTSSALENYGSLSFKMKDPLLAMNEAKKFNYDAVVCIVLLDRKKERIRVPPTFRTGYYTNFYGGYFNPYNGFQNYVNQSFGIVYRPGYYYNTSKYTIEINIFDYHKDSMMYYAKTRTYNIMSMETLSELITQALMKDMVHKKIIPYVKHYKP